MSSSMRPAATIINTKKDLATKEYDYKTKQDDLMAKISKAIPKGTSGLNGVKVYHQSKPINKFFTSLAAQLAIFAENKEEAREIAVIAVSKMMKDFVAQPNAVGDMATVQNAFQPLLELTEELYKMLADLRLEYKSEYAKLKEQFDLESKKSEADKVKIAELNAVVEENRRRSMSAPQIPTVPLKTHTKPATQGNTTADIHRLTMGGLSYQTLAQQMRQTISPADAKEPANKTPLMHLTDFLCTIRQDSKESQKANTASGQLRANAINKLVTFVNTDAATAEDKKVCASLTLEWIVGSATINTSLNHFLQRQDISDNLRTTFAEIMTNSKAETEAKRPAFESDQNILTNLFVLGQAFYLKSFDGFRSTVNANDPAQQRTLNAKIDKYKSRYGVCFDFFPNEFINSPDETDASLTIGKRLMKIYKAANTILFSKENANSANIKPTTDPLRKTIANK